MVLMEKREWKIFFCFTFAFPFLPSPASFFFLFEMLPSSAPLQDCKSILDSCS